jgi:DNA-binding CsgD family transcriptional regulator
VLEEAAKVLATAGAAEDRPPTYARSLLVAARGRLRLTQGDAAGALADALASGEGLSRRSNPAARQWRSDAAWALRALGRLNEAREYAEEELRLAREFEVPHAVGTALRAVAACADGEEAVALLREAVEVLERSEARLELAQALVDLGAALRRSNQRATCQEMLRRGLDLAQRSGATPLAGRARAELLATGARPRRVALSGVESLTASERRVAELAAGEMTNREIAQSLFVTARTVEGHLTHVFRKLDIDSRTQLAERLATELSP